MSDQTRVFGLGYARTPRPSSHSKNGSYHALATEALDVGRLHRKPGDALCKVSRAFWELEIRTGQPNGRVDCRRCIELAQRLGGRLP